jgi:hypothetical protein
MYHEVGLSILFIPAIVHSLCYCIVLLLVSKYHVKNYCIREGEGSIVNYGIKVINELRQKQKSHYGTGRK